jgi:hypothetical protein
MSTPKKIPEFELPPLLLATITEYYGAAKIKKLPGVARSSLASLAAEVAQPIDRIVAGTNDSE